MSLLFADGFEDWTSSSGEYDTNTNFTATASLGRRSGSCVVTSGSSASMTKNLGANYSEIYAAFAYLTTGTQIFCAFLNGATIQVQLLVNADGSISALRNATVIGTSAVGVFTFSVYNQIQVRVVFNDTTGVVQVRLNGSGTPVLNLTSVDTNNAGSNVANIFQMRTSVNTVTRFDDLAIWDTTGSIANTWLGDVRVDSYLPNANGDSSQFVGSDGNSTDNYLLVDAAAPNGTDYVQSSTVNDKDLYGFTNLSHTPASIFGVFVAPSALKDDAGSRSIRMLAKSSATEVDNGSDVTLSTSRARYLGLFETDPNTSAAWTKSGLDAAQFGVKVTV